jgi:hypothetical protein
MGCVASCKSSTDGCQALPEIAAMADRDDVLFIVESSIVSFDWPTHDRREVHLLRPAEVRPPPVAVGHFVGSVEGEMGVISVALVALQALGCHAFRQYPWCALTAPRDPRVEAESSLRMVVPSVCFVLDLFAARDGVIARVTSPTEEVAFNFRLGGSIQCERTRRGRSEWLSRTLVAAQSLGRRCRIRLEAQPPTG